MFTKIKGLGSAGRIFSFTLKELNDGNDMNFTHRQKHLNELGEAYLEYCYANTVLLRCKSSKYNKNGIIYKIYVLLDDFYCIARDRDIPLEDAVRYSIYYGDAHIRCTCPDMLYRGYAYEGTQLKYLYGLPRENRFPKVNNPGLKSTTCKHCQKAIKWCLDHIQDITALFATYYNRLNDGTKLIAVDSTGKEVQIGKKNQEGDIFAEQEDIMGENYEYGDEFDQEVEDIPDDEVAPEEEDDFEPSIDIDEAWDEEE